MMTELSGMLQALLLLSLVVSVPVLLVLLLRKPVRALLGSIACYRLWLLSLLWLPAYLLGKQLLRWWQILRPHKEVSAQTDTGNFQLLLNDWVWQPLGNLGGNPEGGTALSFDVWDVASLLWASGAVAVIGWQLHKYRQFSQRLQQQARPLQAAANEAVEVKAVFGNTLPALVLSDMNSAALFGIRKPVLLLPESFGDHYDADQQHIILAHEAVHLRRHDNAWNLLAGLLVVLCWPNPLMWLAWRCYRFDQELSCDAHALASCTHTQQKRYARTLLDAASTTVGIGPQPALSAWDNLDDLKERTLMIAQHLKNKVSPLVMQSCLSVIAVGGAAVMVLLAGSFSPVTVAAEPTQSDTTANGDTKISEETSRLFEQYIELVNAKKQEEALKFLPTLQQAIDSGRLSNYEIARALQMMFSSYIWNQQYAEARTVMEKAIQLEGGYTEQEKSAGRYQLAQLWMQQENWQAAADALEEWLKTEANPRGGAYYLLAAAYYNLDQFDKALPPAEKALAIGGEASSESWRQMVVALYMHAENYEKALPVIRDLVRLYPDKETYKKQLESVEQELAKRNAQ